MQTAREQRRHLLASAAISTRATPARSAPIRGAIRRRWSSSNQSADLWALERAGAMRASLPRARRHAVAARRHRPGRSQSGEPARARARGRGQGSVLAVNATVDGQTTAHYITDLLGAYHVKVTRLAHGVPVGGELDYLDDGTLAGRDPPAHGVLTARRPPLAPVARQSIWSGSSAGSGRVHDCRIASRLARLRRRAPPSRRAR